MAVLPEKECTACGAFFQPERGNQIYCAQCREATGGRGCRMKIRYDRASENVGRRFAGLDMVPVTFACRQCGEEFEYYVDSRDAETTHKDFCSARCSSLYRIAHTACAWCGTKMARSTPARYAGRRSSTKGIRRRTAPGAAIWKACRRKRAGSIPCPVACAGRRSR